MIIEGYKLNATSLEDIHALFYPLREKGVDLQKTLYMQCASHIMTHLLDALILLPKKQVTDKIVHQKRQFDFPHLSTDNAISYARDLIEARQLRMIKHEYADSAVDYRCHVTILPLVNKSYSLLLIHAAHQDMQKLISSLPSVSYYGYWDTDEPDDSCSTEEWAQRKSDWQEVTQHNPKLVGFDFSISELLPYIELNEKITEYVPTLEVRAKDFAHTNAVYSLSESIRQTKSEEKLTSDIVIEATRQINQQLDGGMYEAELKKTMSKLPSSYTLTDFKKDIGLE